MDEGFVHPRPRSGSVSAAETAYQLLFAGELDGGPGRDGMVYSDEASIEAQLRALLLRRRGRSFYRIFYRIG